MVRADFDVIVALFPKTHDLRVLWDMCRLLISEIEPSATEEDLEAIDEAIAQFCAVDPKSHSFHYPVDRQGNSSIPPTLRVINVRRLRQPT